MNSSGTIAEASARLIALVSIKWATVVVTPMAKATAHMIGLGQAQTRIAGMRVKKVIARLNVRTIARVLSSWDMTRISSTLTAIDMALPSASSAPSCTVSTLRRLRLTCR